MANGFITQLTALGVACGTARQVANEWLGQVRKGLNPAQVIPVQAGARFACAARFSGQVATVLCERNNSPSQPRVVFLAHP